MVKWFDPGKGFGFISVEGAHKDVFVHVSALNRSGLDRLEEGQSVLVRYCQGQKGLEALTVSRK
ncbi:MAG TPA: cold-shock protein [Nitrospiraceae bacterium]|nr:cold-shock protein [Nitrospiraceae bacterium]